MKADVLCLPGQSHCMPCCSSIIPALLLAENFENLFFMFGLFLPEGRFRFRFVLTTFHVILSSFMFRMFPHNLVLLFINLSLKILSLYPPPFPSLFLQDVPMWECIAFFFFFLILSEVFGLRRGWIIRLVLLPSVSYFELSLLVSDLLWYWFCCLKKLKCVSLLLIVGSGQSSINPLLCYNLSAASPVFMVSM